MRQTLYKSLMQEYFGIGKLKAESRKVSTLNFPLIRRFYGKNAQSNADFINKMNIALKEADETEYWLEVLTKSEIINASQVEKLTSDLKEIIAMLVSSIKTCKGKTQ